MAEPDPAELNDYGRPVIEFGDASLRWIAWRLGHLADQGAPGRTPEDWRVLSEIVSLAAELGDALEWALPWLEDVAPSRFTQPARARFRLLQETVREYRATVTRADRIIGDNEEEHLL